jgi:hypothetical protein
MTNALRPSTWKTSPARGSTFCGSAASAAQARFIGRVIVNADSVNASKLRWDEGR